MTREQLIGFLELCGFTLLPKDHPAKNEGDINASYEDCLFFTTNRLDIIKIVTSKCNTRVLGTAFKLVKASFDEC